MIKLASFTKSFIKNTKGTWLKKGRMFNHENSEYLVGFAEINERATTPFARVRVNRGWFFCEPGLIQEGDLVEDRVDERLYLVMSLKTQVLHGESVYLDATLYLCDSVATIERWVDGERDIFGQVLDPYPIQIADNVPILINPQTFTVLEQQDRPIPQDKVRIYLQAKFKVRPADRIIADNGDAYKVMSVDKVSLPNIWICYVDVDER